MISDAPDGAKPAVFARLRRDLAELDYRREVRRLAEDGFTAEQVGNWVGITPDEVKALLRVAADDLMPLEGFSGATPYEICQRYAVGQIDRAQLVDELVRYPYQPMTLTDGYDWLTYDPPGAWSEVSAAERRGLIDIDIYGEVFDLRHPSED